jgi:hypothetical protein
VLVAIKAALGAWLVMRGFSHVSDDDYARTVIAEQFAHAPRLDPSGTSWLPLPFWVAGAGMMVLGRSIDAARGIACVLGAASIVAPYAAMRAVGTPRAAARAATMIAMVIPWNAWLGVATVPDGWTGALLAAGAIAMGLGARSDEGAAIGVGSVGPRDSARRWGAVALLAAALSRYEAWPVCALFVAQSASRAIVAWREERSTGAAIGARAAAVASGTWRGAVGREVALAAVAAAAPLLWMAWNARAHGSPFHFVARVTAFRRSIGAASAPMSEKLLGYPRAIVDETPEVAALALAGIAGAAASRAIRARWAWPMAAAGAVLVFLVVGDLGDGAPTHHPARALASIWWIAAGAGADAAAAAVISAQARGSGARWTAVGVGMIAALAWCLPLDARWRAWPGRGPSERREAQIARGLDLRARGVSAIDVTPCSFEHFAMLAAWGEPWRAKISPRTGKEPTEDCPAVTER